MSGDSAQGDAFWLGKIQAVTQQLDAVAQQLDRLEHRVEGLIEDFDDYVARHDEWCAGLSKAVSGAAAVLASFERYAGARGLITVDVADGTATIDKPKVAEGVAIEDGRGLDAP